MDKGEKTNSSDASKTASPQRSPSQASSLSSNGEICRICHWEGDAGADALVAPCYCSGSLRWVHQHCLQQWIKSSDIKSCELCKFPFVMNTKLKSFSQWESLQMSTLEKRKLVGSVLFHSVALICVLWSLYVLIERTAEELERGALDWSFWTKLVVVGFGSFGGMVFMYIQCKAYFNLCRRWRAYNRVIFIENAPEKQALPPSPPPVPTSNMKPSLVSQTAPGSVIVPIPVVEAETPANRVDAPDNSSDDGETYSLLV